MSAYLKLRGAGPSFLLESAEQGQRFGRWSFLGFRPRTRDPHRGRAAHGRTASERELDERPLRARSPSSWRATALAPLDGLPPFAGGAVGLFGYDLVRTVEPTWPSRSPTTSACPTWR